MLTTLLKKFIESIKYIMYSLLELFSSPLFCGILLSVERADVETIIVLRKWVICAIFIDGYVIMSPRILRGIV